MIDSEKELAGPSAVPASNASNPVECGSHLKKPEDLSGYPKFPAGTKSLVCKYLKEDVWDKLKDAKDKHGFTFKQAILSGC